jgi:hypothetical protein
MTPALRELVRWLAAEAIAEAAAGARADRGTMSDQTPPEPDHDRRDLRPVQHRQAVRGLDR